MLPERVVYADPPRVETDPWVLVEKGAADISGAHVLVPLATWIAWRGELARPGRVGVWLAPDDDPALLVADVHALSLIAIQFPKFTDGRGYSSAVLLRHRLGYKGELRAFGDVGRDQLLYLRRCGFDSFSLPAHRDPQAALSAFDDFSVRYQGSVDDPLPLFRRRALEGRSA